LRLFIAVPLFIGESIYLLEYTPRKKAALRKPQQGRKIRA
jgi:hypothetical protein